MSDHQIKVGRASGEELFRRATEAWEKGEAAAMLPEIERALDDSTDYRLWHIHGLIRRGLDQRELAIPSLQRAVDLNPSAPNPARALARTKYEAGLDSLDDFGRALHLSPGDPEVVKELAMALVANGEVATAITGLEKILGRTPTWSDGQVMLSQLRWMEGERDTFTRGFDEARRAFPQALDLWREQNTSLLHAEQWDKALSVIGESRAIFGEQELFSANEAVIHAEMGNIEVADRLLEPFAQWEDPAFQTRRVRHLLRAARPAEAAAAIEPWLATPDAVMFWPYASIAWRQCDLERWQWLEGDPKFYGVFDMADDLPPLDELAAFLRSLHTLSGQPLEQSLRGGTQTDGDIFMRIDPIMIKLREAIRAKVEAHVAQLPPPDPAHPLLGAARDRIGFAGAWSVRLRDAGFHSNHVHPLGWFSSALYVALPQDMGEGDAGYLVLGNPKSTCFDVDLAPFRTVEPKPGRLALFPSYVWHGTRPFGAGERLSVAFDVARFPSA